MLLQYVVRNMLCDLRQVVVVDVPADGEQPVSVGGAGEGVGDPVGGLPQDVAGLVQADLLPRRAALIVRQHLQQMRDVGGRQGIDPVGHFRHVLAVGQLLHQIAFLRALLDGGVGDHALAVQQRDDGLDLRLQAVFRDWCIGHGSVFLFLPCMESARIAPDASLHWIGGRLSFCGRIGAVNPTRCVSEAAFLFTESPRFATRRSPHREADHNYKNRLSSRPVCP